MRPQSATPGKHNCTCQFIWKRNQQILFLNSTFSSPLHQSCRSCQVWAATENGRHRFTRAAADFTLQNNKTKREKSSSSSADADRQPARSARVGQCEGKGKESEQVRRVGEKAPKSQNPSPSTIYHYYFSPSFISFPSPFSFSFDYDSLLLSFVHTSILTSSKISPGCNGGGGGQDSLHYCSLKKKARRALCTVASARLPLGRREAIAHPVKLLLLLHFFLSFTTGNASFVFWLVLAKKVCFSLSKKPPANYVT